jgi:hypothetical protein
MLNYLTVAPVVRAEIHPPASCAIEAAERRIVAGFRDFVLSPQDEQADKINAIVSELRKTALVLNRVSMSQGKSVHSILTSQSVEHLQQLRRFYENGVLKQTLERVFTILAGEEIRIKRLYWSEYDYNRCLHQLNSYKGIHWEICCAIHYCLTL